MLNKSYVKHIMLLKDKLFKYFSNSSAIIKLYSIARCDKNLSIIEIPNN